MKEIITVKKDIKELFILKDGNQINLDVEYLFSNQNNKSKVEIKAVVFGNATFNFKGNLKILKGAKGTDTFLSIKCLLIGVNAKATVIPSLEIEENEVKAGHGATVSYIDETQRNYLEQKGININDAEKILIDAFIGN